MVVSESGTYFRDVLVDLKGRLSEFPDDDPSPNLRMCIDGSNYVRAEMLARQHNLSLDVVTHLRELAVFQYMVDFENTPGLLRLREDFGFSRDEALRILRLVLSEKKYPGFSYSRNTVMAVDENWSQMWSAKHLSDIQQFSGVVKQSFLSKLIGWFRKVF